MNLGLVGKEETIKKIKEILISRFDNLVVYTYPSADEFMRDTQVRNINFSRIIILQTAFDFRNNVIVSPEDVLRSFGGYIFEKFQGCRVVYITTNDTSHSLFYSLLNSTYVAVIQNKSAKPSFFYNIVDWDIKRIKKELGGEVQLQGVDSEDEVIEDDLVDTPTQPSTSASNPPVKGSEKKVGFFARLGFGSKSKKKSVEKSADQGAGDSSDPVISGETSDTSLSDYFDKTDPWANPEIPIQPEEPLVPVSFRGGSDIGLGSGQDQSDDSKADLDFPSSDDDEDNDHFAFPQDGEEHSTDSEWGGLFPSGESSPSGEGFSSGESLFPAESDSGAGSNGFGSPSEEYHNEQEQDQDWSFGESLQQDRISDVSVEDSDSESQEWGSSSDLLTDEVFETSESETSDSGVGAPDSASSLLDRRKTLEELGKKLRSTPNPSISEASARPSIPTISIPTVEEAQDEDFYVPDAAKVTSEIEREQEEKRKVVVEKVVEKVVVKEVKVGGRTRGANPRIVIVSGDRRSGVTTTAFNLAAASATTEKTLFVDFDLKRRGALLFGVLEQLLASEENIQRGLEGLQSVSILPNIAFPFVEGDFDCILTRYDIVVSDEQLRTVCDVLLGQREYRTIVIDCPVENLAHLRSLIPYAYVLFCLEDDLGSAMNSVVTLSGVFSDERDKIQLYTNLHYLITKGGSVEVHYHNMAHIVELFSLADTTSNWGKSPVVNPTKPVPSLYKELNSNIS